MDIKKTANLLLNFAIKRLAEIFGLFIFLSGTLLLIALITYSPEDPNFIFPDNTEIKNLLGFQGSFISDLFFQSVGLISYLISFTLILTGINIVRLKEKYKNNPITQKSNANDLGEENFMEWAKFIIMSREDILGMNASSISEITGIPRATVIRKLRISERTGMIFKDKRQLYTIGKNYKAKLKDLTRVFSENQIDLCKFVSTFFELYRNPNINKNNK